MLSLLVMRTLTILLILLFSSWSINAQEDADDDPNSKYTVEAVDLQPKLKDRLSIDLKKKLDDMVGKNFDPKVTADVLSELRRQLPRFSVERKLRKGSQRDQIVLAFEAQRRFTVPLASDQVALGYHSSLGWNGKLVVDLEKGPFAVGFGFQNDGQKLIERQAGILGYLQRKNVFSDRLRLRLDWASQRAQWNAATQRNISSARTSVPGLYRDRIYLAPSLTIALADPASFTVGYELNRLRMQDPWLQIRNANAVFAEVGFEERYRSSLKTSATSSIHRHRIAARYRITKSAGGNYDFTRNFAQGNYRWRRGHEEFSAELQLGALTGTAPLLHRFNLGNLTTLRGWNQFDLAALGGSRMVHGSMQYGTHGFFGYYDTGSVWDPNLSQNRTASFKHAAGFGFGSRKASIGIGFPIRSGNITPTFFVSFGN
jgi:hypothetical protein